MIFDLFKKKRQRNFDDNDTPAESNSFSYAPHPTPNIPEYMISAMLVKYEEGFKAACGEALKELNADPFNDSYMDPCILQYEAEAMQVLRFEHSDHIADIRTHFRRTQRGDRIKAETKLAQNEEEQLNAEKELTKLQRIFWKGTSLAEDNENGQAAEPGRTKNEEETV